MKDDHRKKLDKRLTPIHLYKLTPKTNCGKCGHPTCLAFATQVIVAQTPIEACPYLDKEVIEPFTRQLADQQQAGIGVKREGFEKALQFLRQEITNWIFRDIADGLGAELVDEDAQPALKLCYFGREITVTYEDIQGSSPESLNPWEKILIYNYVIGGAGVPSGVWVGMESLPNSVSKIKSLKAHCEQRLAHAFAGGMDHLPAAVSGLGREIALNDEKVDFAAEFQILPKFAVRVLWWDEDTSEGFHAQTKFLFDSKVLETLDLESMLFACEQLTDRLLDFAVS